LMGLLEPAASRLSILVRGFTKVVLRQKSDRQVPKSSTVLRAYLQHRNCPDWTAFYVPYCQAENDLYGKSHFNFQVKPGANYHVLRTGAFPFVKFHCTRRPTADLQLEDRFYLCLKLLNFGLPTLVYGLAGLALARHTETIWVEGESITLLFWYMEDRN